MGRGQKLCTEVCVSTMMTIEAPRLDYILDRILPTPTILISLVLEHFFLKNCNYKSSFYLSEISIFLKVSLQFYNPGNSFLKDLGAIPLKYHHRGRQSPYLPLSVGGWETNFLGWGGGNGQRWCLAPSKTTSCHKNVRKFTFPLGKVKQQTQMTSNLPIPAVKNTFCLFVSVCLSPDSVLAYFLYCNSLD